MARTGHTIDNPVTGDRVRFLQTAAETNGELLRIEYIVTRCENDPHVPLHFHLLSEERFEVLQGKLGVIIGKKKTKQLLQVGESIIIPVGTLHTFWNAGAEALHFSTEIKPPVHFQTYWETMFGLARDGKVNAQGFPNLFQLMVIAETADSYTTDLPLPVLKSTIKIMASIGRRLGYRERYAQYSE